MSKQLSSIRSNLVSIWKGSGCYPIGSLYHPAEAYPEYPFRDSLGTENSVYKAVRASLRLLGLDEMNYGTRAWNPLGDLVRPGDNVLMKQCDLVLRPTNTDGDALTIREALYFGVPVIASDAVRRPTGTILFRNRDAKDLMCRTVDVLKNGTSRTCASAQIDHDTYFKRYPDLYLEVLNS